MLVVGTLGAHSGLAGGRPELEQLQDAQVDAVVLLEAVVH